MGVVKCQWELKSWGSVGDIQDSWDQTAVILAWYLIGSQTCLW